MAKAKKSVFFCQNCGHEESKWLGQCPMCKEWNSFVEECVTTSNTAAVKAAKEIRIVPLSEVKTENEERVTTEIKELDRVLGGGIVRGSLVVACSMEGTRPILLEIQALVCESNFGMPRRTAAGTDYNRVNLLMAVWKKGLDIILEIMMPM